VEVALELRATIDMRAKKVDLVAARHNQTVMVNRLVKAGLLASRGLPKPVEVAEVREVSPADTMNTARVLASTVADLPDDPAAVVRLAAPPISYDPATLPVDGSRPGFSLAGYICNVAQVADPIQVLDRPSHQHVVDQRTGDSLGHAMFRQP
jgi:hypothetical protein